MEAVVVRLEMSPEAAALLEAVAVQYRDSIAQKLTGIVPVHTKAALETQLGHAEEAVQALGVGVANPIEVEIPDPAQT